jgi:hypothetical protein
MAQTLIGLGLNFIGTILVGLAIKKGEGVISVTVAESTVKYRTGMLRFGFVLLCLGFAFQAWGEVVKNIPVHG